MSLLSFAIGILVPLAHAQDKWGGNAPGVAEMWSRISESLFTRANPVTAITGNVVAFLFPLIGAAAVILIIYAGIRMIMGEGKDEVINQAKTIVLYALVGVILAILSTTIVIYFAQTFLPGLLD